MLIDEFCDFRLRFNQQKLNFYNRLDNVMFCSMLIVTGVLALDAILDAEPVGWLHAAIFGCDALATLLWSWDIFYQAYKISYGYEKRPHYYAAWICFRLAIVGLALCASIMNSVDYAGCLLQFGVTHDFMVVVSTIVLAGAICGVGICTAILLHYWFIDRHIWNIYVNELDVNEKIPSFAEYCQTLAE